MKKLIVKLAICLLPVFAAKGQSTPLDKLALEIPVSETYAASGISSYVKSHFSSDSERVRALFVWVASNINYDAESLRSTTPKARPTVSEVLKTRKAVCHGYAELFVELCNQCNIKSVFVPGYVKIPDGSIANLPHAWAAVELNKKWYLFDPTWSAGTVNNFRFTRSFSERYYKVSPQQMIVDHMPFDPMHQFINYPLLFDDFNRGNTVINTTKPFFNYADTLKVFNTLDSLGQFSASARRINNNGEKNAMVYQLLEILNKNQHSGNSKLGFDGAVQRFNLATELFNRYVGSKNKRFSNMKDDKEIQQLIDSSLLHINAAFSLLQNVARDSEENKRSVESFSSAISQLYRRVDDENVFLKRYLKTDRASR